MSKNGKRYGVCENFDNCSNAKSRKVIELDELDDFICPECHSELHEIKKKDGINPKLIIIIAALVVLLGGGGAAAYLLYFNQPTVKEICLNKTKAEIELPADFCSFLYDTLTVTATPESADAKYVWSSSNEGIASVADGIVAIKGGNGEVTIKVALADNPQIKDSCVYTITYQPNDDYDEESDLDEEINDENGAGNTPGNVDLGYAIYDGPRKNGKPNGIGGTLIFKRSYSIDLKKAPAEYVNVYRGDKIVNAKFIDGRLVQGEIHFTDGTRRWINI